MSQPSVSIVLPIPTNEKTSIPDRHCITDGQWGKASYLWTIKGFKEYHCEVNGILRSSKFTSITHPTYMWYLTIDTEIKNLEGEDHIGLFLNIDRVDGDDTLAVLVKMTMCFLDAEGNKVLGRQTREEFTLGDKQHGYPFFISKKALFDPDLKNKILNEDTLTIFCEFDYAPMGCCINATQAVHAVKVAIPDNLPKGLERLLQNQTFVDVTFVVDGKNFGAHKNILASRSPVFEAMFKHDMQENRLNQVSISDIRSEVFEEFLLFMYTDKTPNCKTVTELLVVADKYQVEGLRVLCEEIILKELSVENAIDLLFFADLHKAERLVTQVAFYIKTNPAKLMSTQSWKNAILARPNLFDLVHGVCEVKRPTDPSKLQVPTLSDAYIQKKCETI